MLQLKWVECAVFDMNRCVIQVLSEDRKVSEVISSLSASTRRSC